MKGDERVRRTHFRFTSAAAAEAMLDMDRDIHTYIQSRRFSASRPQSDIHISSRGGHAKDRT
jgi:hypothetical protein